MPAETGHHATALDRITSVLLDHGQTVRRRGPTRADATCPSHEDRSPSLSLRQDADRVLVHCHAGCDTAEILDALRLQLADLYDEPRASSPRPVRQPPDDPLIGDPANLMRRITQQARLESNPEYWSIRAVEFDAAGRPDIAAACRAKAHVLGGRPW
jgi:hypothetical protein